MKKGKILIIICILTVALLCVVPIPHKLKDGGTTYIKPIIPIYEIYIYNTEMLDEDEGVVYKKGYGIYLFGIDVYDNTYYADE